MSSTRGRVLIDTNVLAYRYDRGCPEKAAQAGRALRVLLESGRGVISTQVVCELYQVLVGRMSDRVPRGAALEAVALHADVWPMLGVTPGIAKEAVVSAARDGLSIWDAQLLATAREHGVATVLTEDLDERRDYGGVRALNPFVLEFAVAVLGYGS